MPFTYVDFRQNAELRQIWAQFIHSDIGMILMRVLREKYRPTDVPVGLDALASARILSQFHGAHLALDDLEALAMPPGLDEKEIPLTYQAPDSDHERMPSSEEMQARIRVPTPLPPEGSDNNAA
jgi:hypothetical protein